MYNYLLILSKVGTLCITMKPQLRLMQCGTKYSLTKASKNSLGPVGLVLEVLDEHPFCISSSDPHSATSIFPACITDLC